MLIRKNIRDLSNCQKPIKGKVTIAGSLFAYSNTFSDSVGLSHKLLEIGTILSPLPIFSVLVLSSGYSLEDGQRWFIGFDGLGSDLAQLGLCRDKALTFWSCQSTAPWNDGPLLLYLCTYGPDGNFSMAELEVQAACPTYCMSKLDIILFLSSPIQVPPQ